MKHCMSLIAICAFAYPTLACSSTVDRPIDAAVRDAGPLVDLDGAPPIQPDGAHAADFSCRWSVANPPIEGWTHVPEGTAVSYASNPPSSGPHYPVWAAYGVHSAPVSRGHYVHNLEHGAIVFLYRCSAADDCGAVARTLESIAASLPPDRECGLDPAVRHRVVITPDPLIDVPIAAAAWGWTYTADCLDAPSLGDFARAHYGQGRESTCEDGAQL